jgi:hypothetical protein
MFHVKQSGVRLGPRRSTSRDIPLRWERPAEGQESGSEAFSSLTLESHIDPSLPIPAMPGEDLSVMFHVKQSGVRLRPGVPPRGDSSSGSVKS